MDLNRLGIVVHAYDLEAEAEGSCIFGQLVLFGNFYLFPFVCGVRTGPRALPIGYSMTFWDVGGDSVSKQPPATKQSEKT